MYTKTKLQHTHKIVERNKEIDTGSKRFRLGSIRLSLLSSIHWGIALGMVAASGKLPGYWEMVYARLNLGLQEV